MAENFSLFAPAKLNLGLQITGRYPNGYHHLESLLVPVTLYDRLQISPSAATYIRYYWNFVRDARQRSELSRGVSAHPLLWKSIAWAGSHGFTGQNSYGIPQPQAIASYGKTEPIEEEHTPAMDFRSYGNPPPALEIHVHKHIPSPSGLGGASSDAATLIAYLARLDGPGKLPPQLLTETTRLGADIPFFLQYGLWGVAAQLSGVGAQLQPVDLPSITGVIAVPDFGFSTSAMFSYFRALNLPLRHGEVPPARAATSSGKSALRLDEIAHLDERFPGVRVAQNDFEQAATAVFPQEARRLAAAQEKIARTVRQFFPVPWLAGLTGSGPALYAVTDYPLPTATLKRLSLVLQHRLGTLWQVYPIQNHRLRGYIGP